LRLVVLGACRWAAIRFFGAGRLAALRFMEGR
jgi:hypothetical protein